MNSFSSHLQNQGTKNPVYLYPKQFTKSVSLKPFSKTNCFFMVSDWLEIEFGTPKIP